MELALIDCFSQKSMDFKKKGSDVFIDKRAYFKYPELVEIGSHCAFDNGLHITTRGLFGSYIHIGPYVSIIGGSDSLLVAKDFSTIATGARIICMGEAHLGNGLVGPTIPKEYKDDMVGGTTVLERFSNVLTNAVILPGITVGEGAVIGAGAVLGSNAEPWSIYLGNPARKVKNRNKEAMIQYAKKLISQKDSLVGQI